MFTLKHNSDISSRGHVAMKGHTKIVNQQVVLLHLVFLSPDVERIFGKVACEQVTCYLELWCHAITPNLMQFKADVSILI